MGIGGDIGDLVNRAQGKIGSPGLIKPVAHWKKSPEIHFANSARSQLENTGFNFQPSLGSVNDISDK